MHLSTTTSILDRPGLGTLLGTRAAPTGAVDIPNPELDPLVSEQARFRIDGTGPLPSRTIVPVTQGARELVEARAGVTDAVRGVLRLVEQAAGGPEQGARVELNGIAFANSPRGHGANTWRAHMDDDPIFRAGLAKAAPRDRAGHVAKLGRDAMSETQSTKANVVASWINVGPTASGALLAKAGVVIPGYNDAIGEAELAQAVRVLRHEAQHVADATAPELSAEGALGLREALAEAHSTSLQQLVPARRALGLDGVISDAALQASTTFRPYAEAERTLAGALRVAGLDPAGASGRQLVALPSDQVAEQLVDRLAGAGGTSPDAARRDLAAEFGRALGRRA